MSLPTDPTIVSTRPDATPAEPAAPAAPVERHAPVPMRSPEELAKLLVVGYEPPTPAAAAAATPEPTKEPTPAEPTAAEPETPPAVKAPAKEAAPDPALAGVQREIAEQSRKIDALLAKDAPLTPKESQQVEQAQRKVDALREKMKGEKFDAVESAGELAEGLVELDQENKSLKDQLDAQQKRLEAVEQRGQRSDAEANAARLAELYPKVDIDAVYANALKEAAEITGIDNAKTPADSDLGRVLARAADRIFHQRADVAAKSVAGREAAKAPVTPVTPKPAATPAKTPAATPVTRGGAQFAHKPSGVVTNNAAAGQQDWRVGYLERAKKLVTP